MYVCKDFTGELSKRIGCCLCLKWCHLKCALLTGIKQDNLLKIYWIYTSCLHKASLATNIVEKLDEFNQEISDFKDKVESQTEKVQEELQEVADVLHAGHVERWRRESGK